MLIWQCIVTATLHFILTVILAYNQYERIYVTKAAKTDFVLSNV